MTLSNSSLDTWGARLESVSHDLAERFPGDGPGRQPVHTVYGGAHLFSADTARRMGDLALETVTQWLPDGRTLSGVTGGDPALGDRIHARVVAKLEAEPIEDYRLDFEDGYGNRPDDEEDGHATSAAEAVADGLERGSLPPFVGIRIKSLTGELNRRALRTLDIFLTTLVGVAGQVPPGFTVTLPKIQTTDQVEVLVDAMSEIEAALGLGAPIPIELMVETPQNVVQPDGRVGMRAFVDAGGGRVRGAHFGTYDYTASMNITAAHQTMTHDACDFARNVLQVSLAGTGVWLSDGATNVMPVPIHQGDGLDIAQVDDNRRSIHAAMQLHHDHVRHSLVNGFYQGWDLHPAHLPTRYAAIYGFFLESLESAGARLTSFVESAAKATLVGDVFDDAATGQGLLNFFLRAVNCGAITEAEALERSGLTLEELHSRSFLSILEGRRG